MPAGTVGKCRDFPDTAAFRQEAATDEFRTGLFVRNLDGYTGFATVDVRILRVRHIIETVLCGEMESIPCIEPDAFREFLSAADEECGRCTVIGEGEHLV